jgi:uncharacterized protein YjbJ (UPF0337 family)
MFTTGQKNNLLEDQAMTNVKDKIKSEKNKVTGAIKENVGKAVGNTKLEGEGATQRAKGEAQNAVDSAKDAFKSSMK